MKKNNNNVTAIIIPGLLGYKEEIQIVELKNALSAITIKSITFTPSSMTTDKEGLLSEYSQKAIYSELLNIIKDNQIEDSKLILIGLSAGGPIAFKYAAKNDILAVIGIVTPYQTGDGDDLSQIKDEWGTKGYIEMESSRLGNIKLPYSYLEKSLDFNILNYGEKVSCPKLFIAGELDNNVPTKATRKAYEVCNGEKEIHIIKGMQHKYKNNSSHINEVNVIVKDFIMKYYKNINKMIAPNV